MRRKKHESKKLFEKFLELSALLPRLSDRELARMLGVSHPTIARWRKNLHPLRETKQSRIEKLYLSMDESLKAKLKAMLENLSSRKGISRRTSRSKIYQLLEVDFMALGVKDKTEGLKLISYFVEKEYGSWENLEQKTRPRKEKPRYRTAKGKIQREPATLSIDATGYTFRLRDGSKEYQVSVFLACDVYSGCIYPEPLLVENTEKAVLFYNKAFNSRNLAKWLIEIFTSWGVPQKVISDKDPVIKNEYIKSAFYLLGIEHLFTKHPNQNPIERYIREIKEWLSADLERVKSKEEIIEKFRIAIERFNRTSHRFDHFKEPVIPEEILPASLREYVKEEENKIRQSFMECAIRAVRNSTITWDGYKYVFNLPAKLREGEIGRKPQPVKVLVRRHVDNASYLEVYDLRTKEFLGFAQLFSQDVPTTDPTERKEIKDRERRARKRQKKLTREVEEIQNLKAQEEEPSIKLSDLLSAGEEESTSPLSVWEILNKGGET